MRSLQILAGPSARRRLAAHGLRSTDVRAIPAAAGGPKFLALAGLDRYLFGSWLADAGPPLHVVGASVGAWRAACAAMPGADGNFARLAQLYIGEEYEPAPGKPQSRENIGRRYAALVEEFFRGREGEVLLHPRRRAHVVADRGRGLLRNDPPLLRHAGFALATIANAIDRRLLGTCLERVVFSDPRDALPLALDDLPTRRVALRESNLRQAIVASGSIPFWLPSVHDIPQAPPGAYWDGGMTDYHLHWPWSALGEDGEGVVLYPHFQTRVVPGWLDKPLRRRHGFTAALDNVVVLAPTAHWIAALPDGKLPDRNDFKKWGRDHAGRQRVWTTALQDSVRLAEDLDAWLRGGCPMGEVGELENVR